MYGETTNTPGPGVYQCARPGDGTFESVQLEDPPHEAQELASKLRRVKYRMARIKRTETETVASKLERRKLTQLKAMERDLTERLTALSADLTAAEAAKPRAKSRPPSRAQTPAASLFRSSLGSTGLSTLAPRPNTAGTAFTSTTNRFDAFPYIDRAKASPGAVYDLGETGGAFDRAQKPRADGPPHREPMAGSKLPHWHLLSRTTTGLLATELSKHELGPGQYEPPIAQYTQFRPRIGSPAQKTSSGAPVPVFTVAVPASKPPVGVRDTYRIRLPKNKLPYSSYIKEQGKERASRAASTRRQADIAAVQSLDLWKK